MPPEIVVGLLSLLGTLFGSIAGIMTSNKLTIYRIDQLEQKVNKHNNLIERVYHVEERITVVEHSLNDIKEHEDS